MSADSKRRKVCIMENSLINSLKRLERVGSETSRVTEKLKKAVEEVSQKIMECIKPVLPERESIYPDFTPIAEKLYYCKRCLIWDYDGYADEITYTDYDLRPSEGYVKREVALNFAAAIANGLLKKIVSKVEKENAETLKQMNVINSQEI